MGRGLVIRPLNGAPAARLDRRRWITRVGKIVFRAPTYLSRVGSVCQTLRASVHPEFAKAVFPRSLRAPPPGVVGRGVINCGVVAAFPQGILSLWMLRELGSQDFFENRHLLAFPVRVLCRLIRFVGEQLGLTWAARIANCLPATRVGAFGSLV